MKWRWIAVVGLLLPLSGCVYIENTCPWPGATQKGTCYYFLTITKTEKKTDGTYDVRGQVAQAAVDKNRILTLGWLGLLKVEDYKLEDYKFFEYPIPLDQSTAEKVVVGKDYWLVSKLNSSILSPYTPETPEALAKLLKEYPSTQPWDSPTAK